MLKFLTDKGWDIEDIKESGLVNKYGFDFLQDKITIPYNWATEPGRLRYLPPICLPRIVVTLPFPHTG